MPGRSKESVDCPFKSLQGHGFKSVSFSHCRPAVNSRQAFTLVETLAAIAGLVIALGLMVSLARHVRIDSAEQLSRNILFRMDHAMAQYVQQYGQLPAIPPLMADPVQAPSEAVLQRTAERNNEACVRTLRAAGLLNGVFEDLSVAYFDEARVRDAWGSPVVFMSTPQNSIGSGIGMDAKGWFFFSAGPDRRYLTVEDNLYSYEPAPKK
jgi:type II secretory pathway pseudopilin PulG